MDAICGIVMWCSLCNVYGYIHYLSIDLSLYRSIHRDNAERKAPHEVTAPRGTSAHIQPMHRGQLSKPCKRAEGAAKKELERALGLGTFQRLGVCLFSAVDVRGGECSAGDSELLFVRLGVRVVAIRK